MIALVACAGEAPLAARELRGGLEVVAPVPVVWVGVETADGVPVLVQDVSPPAARVALPARPPRASTWVVRAERADGRLQATVLDGPTFPVALSLDVGGQRWPVWDEQAIASWSGLPVALRLEARRATTLDVTVDRLTTTFRLEPGAVAEVPLPAEEAEVLVQAGAVHVEVEVWARAPDATPPRILAVRFPVDARDRPREDGTFAAVDLGYQGDGRLCAFVRTSTGEVRVRLVPGGRATALVPARPGDRVELVPLGATAPTDAREVDRPLSPPASPPGAPRRTPSPDR